MRKINIHGGEFEITDEAATALIAAGSLYHCGDASCGHDLHLTPDHEWSVDDIEAILTSIMGMPVVPNAFTRMNAKAESVGAPQLFGPHMDVWEAIDHAMAVAMTAALQSNPPTASTPNAIIVSKIETVLDDASQINGIVDRMAYVGAFLRMWQGHLSGKA